MKKFLTLFAVVSLLALTGCGLEDAVNSTLDDVSEEIGETVEAGEEALDDASEAIGENVDAAEDKMEEGGAALEEEVNAMFE